MGSKKEMTMKKLLLALAALTVAGSLSAGSIDYLSNQSADYLRTFSRNASLDVDAAVYNPAGTAFFAPGLTVGLSNQSIWKLYENDWTTPSAAIHPASKTYESTVPTLFLPNLQVVYGAGAWAAYLTTGVTAGGGTADYSDGVPYMMLAAVDQLGHPLVTGNALTTATGVTLASGNITSTSLYPQLTLGGAYAFNETLSFSAGLRAVEGYKTFSGKAVYDFSTAGAGTIRVTKEVDATQTAFGLGAVFGADWKPLTGLLVTTRIETATPLEFKTSVADGKDFNLFVDGSKQRRDLPALVALGTSYNWNALTVTASGTAYFLGLSQSAIYSDDYADLGWEAGASAEYALLPGFLKLSLGGLYTVVGGNDKTYNDFDFSLDSKSIGGGLVVTPLKDLDVTLSASNTFYTTAEGQGGTTEYKKNATTVGIACQYKFF